MKINYKVFKNLNNPIDVQDLDGRHVEIHIMNETSYFANYVNRGQYALWTSDGKSYKLLIEEGYYNEFKEVFSPKMNIAWIEYFEKIVKSRKRVSRGFWYPALILVVLVFLAVLILPLPGVPFEVPAIILSFIDDHTPKVLFGAVIFLILMSILNSSVFKSRANKIQTEHANKVTEILGAERSHELALQQDTYHMRYMAQFDEEVAKEETLEESQDEIKILPVADLKEESTEVVETEEEIVVELFEDDKEIETEPLEDEEEVIIELFEDDEEVIVELFEEDESEVELFQDDEEIVIELFEEEIPEEQEEPLFDIFEDEPVFEPIIEIRDEVLAEPSEKDVVTEEKFEKVFTSLDEIAAKLESLSKVVESSLKEAPVKEEVVVIKEVVKEPAKEKVAEEVKEPKKEVVLEQQEDKVILEELSVLKVAELKEFAKERKVANFSSMNKTQLLEQFPSNLQDLRVVELKAVAKAKDLSNYNALNKTELIKLISTKEEVVEVEVKKPVKEEVVKVEEVKEPKKVVVKPKEPKKEIGKSALEDLKLLKVVELREFAKNRNIVNYSSMNKTQLLEELPLEYPKLRVEELKAIAKTKELTNYSALNKGQLIDLLTEEEESLEEKDDKVVEQLRLLKVETLKEFAKERKIVNFSVMNKQELIESLPGELEDLHVEELKEIVKAMNVSNFSLMTKPELIDVIVNGPQEVVVKEEDTLVEEVSKDPLKTLQLLTVVQLREFVKNRNISNFSIMTKPQLINALPESYEKLRVEELKALAKKLELRNYSVMNKQELIEAIKGQLGE